MGITTPREIPVEEVKGGYLLDLAADQYADPDGNDPRLDSEYAVALHDAFRETPECTTLHIKGVDLFGFPTGHMVTVCGADDDHEPPAEPCICGYPSISDGAHKR